MDEKEGKPIFVGWREYEIRCHVLLLTLLLTLQADLHDLETCKWYKIVRTWTRVKLTQNCDCK